MDKIFTIIFLTALIAYFLILIFMAGIFKRGKLKSLITKRVNELVSDLVYLNSELSVQPKGSFIYAKIELAYAITELKIEINKLLLKIWQRD